MLKTCNEFFVNIGYVAMSSAPSLIAAAIQEKDCLVL